MFLIGDYFHNYPSTDYDFYFKNKTRLDNAKTITDGFHMPVHLGFGNHDYDVKNISRDMSHRLFKSKFNTEPYSVLDYKGWKFIHLNNFLGSTQDRSAANFNPSIGSLGETQLHWLEAQLQQHKPTFVLVHYPLPAIVPTEFSDYGLHPLLRKYSDTVQLVVTGHVHKWIDVGHTYRPQHYIMACYPLRPQRIHAHGSRPQDPEVALYQRRLGRVVNALRQAISLRHSTPVLHGIRDRNGGVRI